MCSTLKDRLPLVKSSLDALFAGATAAERDDLVKELCADLALRKSTATRPAYDKHSNSATG